MFQRNFVSHGSPGLGSLPTPSTLLLQQEAQNQPSWGARGRLKENLGGSPDGGRGSPGGPLQRGLVILILAREGMGHESSPWIVEGSSLEGWIYLGVERLSPRLNGPASLSSCRKITLGSGGPWNQPSAGSPSGNQNSRTENGAKPVSLRSGFLFHKRTSGSFQRMLSSEVPLPCLTGVRPQLPFQAGFCENRIHLKSLRPARDRKSP